MHEDEDGDISDKSVSACSQRNPSLLRTPKGLALVTTSQPFLRQQVQGAINIGASLVAPEEVADLGSRQSSLAVRLKVPAEPISQRVPQGQPEAAWLLGIAPHVLRDCRLRGELKGKKVGKAFVYSRTELARFLEDTK